MNLEAFCVTLGRLNLSQPRQAVAILWFVDNATPNEGRTAGELARIIRDAGLGNPHSTKLGEAVIATRHALRSKTVLRIKPTSRSIVASWVASIVAAPTPKIDDDLGYLPIAVWRGTRGYIEKLARQINGCYQFEFFDGASVLVRRLIETLLIDCYETQKLDHLIKKSDGSYPMLSDIITGVVDKRHLSLNRETEKCLRDIKTVGDRSAHARRYNAVKADLDKLHSGVRMAVDDLLHLAQFK